MPSREALAPLASLPWMLQPIQRTVGISAVFSPADWSGSLNLRCSVRMDSIRAWLAGEVTVSTT